RPGAAAPPPLAGRVLVHASGFRQSPYADLRPAGDDVRSSRSISRRSAAGAADELAGPADDGHRRARTPRKLWHSSAGSSGW
ncbi:hypothetical protein GTQ99_16505, partial [Kineococcus sp. T13]|uniref:hypothetical protein n=1 Tax=Kineococcus vitellinus TaxID=2696565 RepID=UPI0014135035